VGQLLRGERIDLVAAGHDGDLPDGSIAPTDTHRERPGLNRFVGEGDNDLERRFALERQVRGRRRNREEV
jgi:hypothetical protein